MRQFILTLCVMFSGILWSHAEGFSALDKFGPVLLTNWFDLRQPEAELVSRPKGDLQKVKIVTRLRTETTMTVACIAGRLRMGTTGYVNNRLYRQRKGLMSDQYQELTPLRKRNWFAAQRRFGEGEDGDAPEDRNDDDGRRDRRTFADGDNRIREQPALSAAKD